MTSQTTTEPDVDHETESVQGSLAAAVRDYVARLRGGDVGSLPAVLGLVVLVVIFSILRPDKFTTAFNFANLLHQAAAVIVIAMGLVFVLLLGEIDLSAGWTAGTGAAVMGITATNHGWPWWTAILACLATGAAIGVFIGLLVAYLGIPSFVVTLALFLGLQGVLLKLIGEGGTISIVQSDILVSINTKDVPVLLGWIIAVGTIVVYGFVSIRRAQVRRAGGLHTAPIAVVGAKIIVLAVLLLAGTAFLSGERSLNRANASIKGIPIVVMLLLVLLVGLNFVLTRTAFGQHIYAVGGNTEAARRAGINVRQVKLACFMIGSTLAAVAGVLIASRNASISPTTGGADTLLYAVGAAVIGGTSLFGGKGRILDAILGGLVIAVIVNGMALMQQPSSKVYMATGIVLLVAASVDALSRRRATSTGQL